MANYAEGEPKNLDNVKILGLLVFCCVLSDIFHTYIPKLRIKTHHPTNNNTYEHDQ